jgi:hypothetical protein
MPLSEDATKGRDGLHEAHAALGRKTVEVDAEPGQSNGRGLPLRAQDDGPPERLVWHMDVVARQGQEDAVAVAVLQVGHHAPAVDHHRCPGAGDIFCRDGTDCGHRLAVEDVLRDENRQGIKKIRLHGAQPLLCPAGQGHLPLGRPKHYSLPLGITKGSSSSIIFRLATPLYLMVVC